MVNELAKRQLQPRLPAREGWRGELETRRKAIYRDCPITEVIDREHALARVAGVMQGGHGSTMARRYLIRGLLGDGFTYADVAQALRAERDEMERAQGELPLWEYGVKALAALHDVTPPSDSPVIDEGRSVPNTPRRQGNLKRASDGFRSPYEPSEPRGTPRK